MSFTGSIQTFALKTPQRIRAVHVISAVEIQRSVKFGSELTGAPEMPVAPNDFPRAGALKASITLTYPDENTALIYTTKPYAPDVEDNVKGHQFNTGGPHGWKLTQAAFPRIVETVAKRVAK
jgi:hypothetical protein